MTPFSFVPQKLLYELLAVVVLVAGGVWFGYVKGSDKSALVISNYKAQVVDLNTKLEQKKAVVIDHVVTQYKTKIVHIKDVGVHNANTIQTIPSTCTMSTGWVRLHDAAATGVIAEPTNPNDGTTSGIKDTEALGVINFNYQTFLNQKAELEALQQWVTETNAAIAAANAQVKKKHWWNR